VTKLEYPPVSYIAGFFDANGTIYVADTSRNAPRLRVSITTTSKTLLTIFQKVLGLGTVTLHQKREVYDDQWRLNITSIAEVSAFIDIVGPHSVVKHRQMILARRFIEQVQGYGIGRALDASELSIRLELAYAISEANSFGRKLSDNGDTDIDDCELEATTNDQGK
jgi:hypothetical protein